MASEQAGPQGPQQQQQQQGLQGLQAEAQHALVVDLRRRAESAFHDAIRAVRDCDDPHVLEAAAASAESLARTIRSQPHRIAAAASSPSLLHAPKESSPLRSTTSLCPDALALQPDLPAPPSAAATTAAAATAGVPACPPLVDDAAQAQNAGRPSSRRLKKETSGGRLLAPQLVPVETAALRSRSPPAVLSVVSAGERPQSSASHLSVHVPSASTLGAQPVSPVRPKSPGHLSLSPKHALPPPLPPTLAQSPETAEAAADATPAPLSVSISANAGAGGGSGSGSGARPREVPPRPKLRRLGSLGAPDTEDLLAALGGTPAAVLRQNMATHHAAQLLAPALLQPLQPLASAGGGSSSSGSGGSVVLLECETGEAMGALQGPRVLRPGRHSRMASDSVALQQADETLKALREVLVQQQQHLGAVGSSPRPASQQSLRPPLLRNTMTRSAEDKPKLRRLGSLGAPDTEDLLAALGGTPAAVLRQNMATHHAAQLLAPALLQPLQPLASAGGGSSSSGSGGSVVLLECETGEAMGALQGPRVLRPGRHSRMASDSVALQQADETLKALREVLVQQQQHLGAVGSSPRPASQQSLRPPLLRNTMTRSAEDKCDCPLQPLPQQAQPQRLDLSGSAIA
eukprot:m51a1_g241 hypothetical protein (631) ;mRNA; f:143263-145454